MCINRPGKEVISENASVSECSGFGWSRVNLLTLAAMRLCFAFVMKKLLITQCYGIVFTTSEQNLHSLTVFSVPHPIPPVSLHKKLWGETAGAADPADIPDHMMSCSEYKFGERRKAGGRRVWWGGRLEIWSNGIFLPTHCYLWQIPAFLNIFPECWPADGNLYINSLFCLHVQLFILPFEQFLSQPTIFLIFYSSDSLLHPTSPQSHRNWVRHSVMSSYRLGLNRDIVGN